MQGRSGPSLLCSDSPDKTYLQTPNRLLSRFECQVHGFKLYLLALI